MNTENKYAVVFNDLVAHIKQLHDGKRSLDENTVAALLKALDRSWKSIKDRCDELINETKQSFLQDNEKGLDRHKMAACFIIAIIEQFDTSQIDKDAPTASKLIREKIAIGIGQVVLLTMIKGQDKKNKNKELIAFLSKNKNEFMPPNVLCDDGDYEQNLALALYYDRKEGKRLSVLLLSNILFWIETYNWECAKKQGKISSLSHKPAGFTQIH